MQYKGHKITERLDGRYEAKYTLSDGRRVSVYGKTQKACYQKLKEVVDEDSGTKKIKKFIPQYNLYEWLDYWLETYKKDRRSNDNDCAVKNIKKHSKNIKLKDINVNFIQEVLNKIETSRARVTVYHVFNMALRTAYNNEYIKANPVDKIEKPKHTKQEGKALTYQDEEILIERVNNSELKNVILFYLYSGCRRSETLTLKGKDIDYENKLIHIHGTKTDGSDRYIPLFPKLLKCIPENIQADELLFNYKADYITHEFKKIMPEYAVKDLRTTFATRMHEQGIPPKYIQKWMGHTSLLTTEKSYIKANNDLFEKQLLKQLQNKD